MLKISRFFVWFSRHFCYKYWCIFRVMGEIGLVFGYYFY
nr:MAG TPA: hypothetical protein [Caudoviricetes sp.]